MKLVSASAGAQVLSLLAAPFIARLFAPEAFGVAALFVSITGLISAVVGMRYELSIMLPEEDAEAANTAAVSLCFVVLVTTATAISFRFFGNAVLGLFHATELKVILWLVPVHVLLNGIFSVSMYWNMRKKNFGVQSFAQFGGTAFFVVAQIAVGLAGLRSGRAIVAATVLSALASTLILARQALCVSWRVFLHEVRFARMIRALKRYSSFPKFSTASALLNNLGWQIPTFFLSAFFSATVVGHYALGNRLLRLPVSLIGANIATVFFQHATEASHKGTLSKSVEKLFHHLISLFLFPSLLLTLVGKDLFLLVFGSQWAEAGVYTQILSVYVLFWFMAVPLGIALNVLEKQALELRLIIGVLLLRVVALFIGGSTGSARVALVLFSVAGVVAYSYYLFVVLRRCAVPLARIGRLLGKNLGIFVPAGLLIGTLHWFQVPSTIVLGVAFLLLVLYYSQWIRSDPDAGKAFSNLYRRLIPARAV